MWINNKVIHKSRKLGYSHYIRIMKVKNNIKKDRGYSIKIEQHIYDKLKAYCKDRGIKIGHLASKAIEEKITVLNLQ
jgi:predicted DNA-binding ribbon-helix-helix protein